MHLRKYSFFLLLLVLASCHKDQSDEQKVMQKLPQIYSGIVQSICDGVARVKQTEVTSVTVARQLRSFKFVDKEERISDFNMADFLLDAKEVDYELSSLDLEGFQITMTDSKEITKKPLYESTHHQYLIDNSSDYCYGVLFSKPMIKASKNGEIELIIKATRYLEHPVGSHYYHAVVSQDTVAVTALDLQMKVIKLY